MKAQSIWNRQNPITQTPYQSSKGYPYNKENASPSSKFINLLKRKDKKSRESHRNSDSTSNHIPLFDPNELKYLIKRNTNLICANNKSKNFVKSNRITSITKNDSLKTPAQELVNVKDNQSVNKIDYKGLLKVIQSPTKNILKLKDFLPENYRSADKRTTVTALNRSSNQIYGDVSQKRFELKSDRSSPNLKIITIESQTNIKPLAEYRTVYPGFKVNSCCVNHPNKRSKYFIKNAPAFNKDVEITQPGYCSNCTFNLVKNGRNCEEIILGEQSYKENKLSDFLQNLRKEQDNCEYGLQTLTIKGEDMTNRLQKEIGKVDLYFDLLIDNLNKQRSHIAERLINNFTQSSNMLADLRSSLTSFKSEFGVISKDIDATYNMIIETPHVEPFDEIIKCYTSKLEENRQLLKKLENLKVSYERVEFDKKIEAIRHELQVPFEIRCVHYGLIELKSDISNQTYLENDIISKNMQVSLSLSNLLTEERLENGSDIKLANNPQNLALNKSDDKFCRTNNIDSELTHKDASTSEVIQARPGFKVDTYENSIRTQNSMQLLDIQLLHLKGVTSQHGSFQSGNNIESNDQVEVISGNDQLFELERSDLTELFKKPTPDLDVKDDPAEQIREYYNSFMTNRTIKDGRQDPRNDQTDHFKLKDFKSQKVLF